MSTEFEAIVTRPGTGVPRRSIAKALLWSVVISIAVMLILNESNLSNLSNHEVFEANRLRSHLVMAFCAVCLVAYLILNFVNRGLPQLDRTMSRTIDIVGSAIALPLLAYSMWQLNNWEHLDALRQLHTLHH